MLSKGLHGVLVLHDKKEWGDGLLAFRGFVGLP
jgi:hypothetical protein